MRWWHGPEWKKKAPKPQQAAVKRWASNGPPTAALVVTDGLTFTVNQWSALYDQYLQSKSRKLIPLRAAGRETGSQWKNNHSVTDQKLIDRAAVVDEYVKLYKATGTVSE
jgi:hypothetical protein